MRRYRDRSSESSTGCDPRSRGSGTRWLRRRGRDSGRCFWSTTIVAAWTIARHRPSWLAVALVVTAWTAMIFQGLAGGGPVARYYIAVVPLVALALLVLASPYRWATWAVIVTSIGVAVVWGPRSASERRRMGAGGAGRRRGCRPGGGTAAGRVQGVHRASRCGARRRPAHTRATRTRELGAALLFVGRASRRRPLRRRKCHGRQDLRRMRSAGLAEIARDSSDNSLRLQPAATRRRNEGRPQTRNRLRPGVRYSDADGLPVSGRIRVSHDR